MGQLPGSSDLCTPFTRFWVFGGAIQITSKMAPPNTQKRVKGVQIFRSFIYGTTARIFRSLYALYSLLGIRWRHPDNIKDGATEYPKASKGRTDIPSLHLWHNCQALPISVRPLLAFGYSVAPSR